jgi:hypothetical protein
MLASDGYGVFSGAFKIRHAASFCLKVYEQDSVKTEGSN